MQPITRKHQNKFLIMISSNGYGVSQGNRKVELPNNRLTPLYYQGNWVLVFGHLSLVLSEAASSTLCFFVCFVVNFQQSF